MKDERYLKSKVENYIEKEQLFRSEENKKLEKSFLAKARKNYSVASLLLKISEDEATKKLLNLTSDFAMYDWVIIVAYYSMYSASLSALARLGYKSKSHSATIAVLELSYAKYDVLKSDHINKLEKAYELSEQLITKLIQTKTKRETAQYDATPAISGEMAITALDDADEFITKIEKMLIQ